KVCFELDRSSSQDLLASDGDRRFRFARTLDRQLERFDGVRDRSGAHVRGSAGANERKVTCRKKQNRTQSFRATPKASRRKFRSDLTNSPPTSRFHMAGPIPAHRLTISSWPPSAPARR